MNAAERETVESGRRIYIQELCFSMESLRSPELLNETCQLLAGLTIPRSIAHSISEIEMFTSAEDIYSADSLVQELGLREKQTEYLRSLNIRLNGSDPFTILTDEESIVANCFFSNYYTLATDEESANKMFADNRSIAEIRSLNSSGLLLVSPKQLVSKPDKKSAKHWYSEDIIEDSVTLVASQTASLISEKNTPDVAYQINGDIEKSSLNLSARLKKITTSFLFA